jgi:hypothetical protein
MKRLVLILIVVLILFGAMMFYGLNRDDSSSRASQPPDWMGLFDNFVHKQPVTARDVLPAACFPPGASIFKFVDACKVHIRSVDETSTRTMKLEMTVGGQAKIDLQTLGEAGMRMSLPLRSAMPKSPNLQIPKEGADLTIVCETPARDLVDQTFGCELKITQ